MERVGSPAIAGRSSDPRTDRPGCEGRSKTGCRAECRARSQDNQRARFRAYGSSRNPGLRCAAPPAWRLSAWCLERDVGFLEVLLGAEGGVGLRVGAGRLAAAAVAAVA